MQWILSCRIWHWHWKHYSSLKIIWTNITSNYLSFFLLLSILLIPGELLNFCNKEVNIPVHSAFYRIINIRGISKHVLLNRSLNFFHNSSLSFIKIYGKYYARLFSFSLTIIISVLSTDLMLPPSSGSEPPSNLVAG